MRSYAGSFRDPVWIAVQPSAPIPVRGGNARETRSIGRRHGNGGVVSGGAGARCASRQPHLPVADPRLPFRPDESRTRTV